MHNSQPQYWLRGRVLVLVVLSAVVPVGSLSALIGSIEAAVLTWDADPGTAGAQDGSGDWDTTTPNWISGSGNVTWTAGDDAVFGAGGTGPATVSLTEAISARNLTFSTGASYTLTGSTLTRTGTITVNATEARIDAALAGSRINKYGAGTLILAGDNTVGSAALDIHGGVVSLRHDNAMGGHDYTHVYAVGAALEVQDNITVAKDLYIKEHGVSGTGSLRSVSGDNTWSGWVKMHWGHPDSSIGVDAGSTLTVTGTVEASGGSDGALRKVGGGMLILTANNPYHWPTYIEAGVLNIRHNNALGTTAGATTVLSGAALEVQGGITVAEAITLNGTGVSDNGALRSKSGNNVWAGTINVAQTSNIQVDLGSTLALHGAITGSSGYLRKTGPGTLVLNADNSAFTEHMDVAAGTVSLHDANGVPGAYFHVTNAGSTVELAGGINVPGGKTMYLSGGAASDSLPTLSSVSGHNVWNGNVVFHHGTGNRNIGVAAGGTLTLAGIVSGDADKNLIKIGDGTLILSSDNTYTGATRVVAGVLSLRHSNALGTDGVDVASGAAVHLQDDIAVSTGTLTVSGGTPLRSVSGDNAWNTPIHVAGTTGSSVASQIQVDTDSTLALYGPLSRSGQVHLRKVGNGTLIIDADNTAFDRWMDVSGGVLSLRNADGFPGSYFHVNNSNAVLELAGGFTIPSGKIIYLSGGATSDTVATLYNASGDNVHNGTVVLHSGSGNRNIGVAAGTSLTLAGVVSGVDRNLVKIGEGTLILGTDNTYTGTTRVAAGTLLVNGSLHGSSAVTVQAGGTLGGTGTIGGPTSIETGGTLATGASVGTLTFASDLTLAGGSIWDWEFIDSTLGNYDQAVGTGGAALILPTENSTPITLNIFGDASGHSLNWYDEFTIFDGAVENFDAGLFDLVNHSDWAHGWQIFSNGQDLVLTAVPEPGTIALLTFGLLALLPRRKCR